jgi:hypothetical protein
MNINKKNKNFKSCNHMDMFFQKNYNLSDDSKLNSLCNDENHSPERSLLTSQKTNNNKTENNENVDTPKTDAIDKNSSLTDPFISNYFEIIKNFYKKFRNTCSEESVNVADHLISNRIDSYFCHECCNEQSHGNNTDNDIGTISTRLVYLNNTNNNNNQK